MRTGSRNDNIMTRSGLRILAYGLYDWAQSPMPRCIRPSFLLSILPQPSCLRRVCRLGLAECRNSDLYCAGGTFLGVIADQYGWRKAMLFITSMGSIIAVSLLWYIKPDPSFAVMALLLSAGVMICGELALFLSCAAACCCAAGTARACFRPCLGDGVFRCYFLPAAGALCSFSRTHLLWPQSEEAEPVRATMPLAGLWFLIFALPVFLFVPEGRTDRAFRDSMVKGWQVVRQTPGCCASSWPLALCRCAGDAFCHGRHFRRPYPRLQPAGCDHLCHHSQYYRRAGGRYRRSCR